MNQGTTTEGPINPFTFQKDQFVHDYPQTLEELKVVARHWWEQYMETFVVCTLLRRISTSDLRRSEYASYRLHQAMKSLGVDVFAKIQKDAQDVLRRRFGDELWQFVCDNETDDDYQQMLKKVGWPFVFKR